MKKKTKEKLEVFFVNIDENMRHQENIVFIIDCLGHNKN